ncbi:MAG: sugar ABC transporter ATP-binding protein [Hyphomicrobiales bacterium]
MQITGIEKAFGTNRVLRGIDLTLEPGTVTVLMGANGAGKSTLVKIMCGVYSADAGQMFLNGAPFLPSVPSEALRSGVVTVHQSINDGVIADLDVASNLMLDRLAEPGSGFFYKRKAIHNAAREIAALVGLDVDMARPVSELSLADRQLVSIARAMAHKPKLLVLDEPTSSLSATEADRLFEMVDRLRAANVAILYISHRMSDIRRIADRIISMRDGAISGSFETLPLDYEGAVNAMLGHQMTDVDIDIPEKGAAILELKAAQLKPGSKPFNASFYENEVVAITGLVGSGKTLLADILFGLNKLASGSVTLNGKSFEASSAKSAVEQGVFMSPKDRATNAVVQGFDIRANISVPFLERYSSASFVSKTTESQIANQTIQKLGIVCQAASDDIDTLSGGNQQKVVVGRWLSQPCQVLVLDEPFQGVDIQARRDIGRKIRETAKGRTTLVMASELDEALEIADRILVVSDHTIVGEHRNESIDLDQLLAEVAGRQQIAGGSEPALGH